MGRGWLIRVLALGACSAYATFPLATDEAGTQDVGTFQLETGGCYERGSGCRNIDVPVALTYGVLPRWDIAAGWGEQFERHTGDNGNIEHVGGCDDFSLSSKLLFLGEDAWLPAQTLCPAVVLPAADEGEGLGSGVADYDLTWMASKAITDKLNAHANVGYTWVGDPSGDDLSDVVHYGVAADYLLAERLQAIGEVVGEALPEGGTSWFFRSGFRYAVSDSFALVLAAGSKIAGDAPEFCAESGIVWVWETSGSTGRQER